MLRSVQLAGATHPWWHHEAQRVLRHIGDGPGRISVLPLLIRVHGRADEHEVADWLAQALRERGLPSLELTPAKGEDLKASLHRRLDLPSGALPVALAKRPQVIVLRLGARTEPDFLRDAERALEEMGKATGGAFSMLIALAASGVAVHSYQEADLRRVTPPPALLDALRGPEVSAWRHYLHLRIAWECAFHLEDARRLEKRAGQVPLERDDQLEAQLNQHAQRKLREQNARRLKPLQELRRVAPNSRALGDLLYELGWVGLAWQPPGHSELFLVPWLARALLIEEVEGWFTPLLRQSMICQPLAAQVLADCLSQEATLRAITHRVCAANRQDSADAAQAAQDDLRLFRKAGYYPEGHPAPPASSLDWGTLGDVLRAARLGADPLPIRRVRNGAAHGHYPTWGSLRAIAPERLKKLLESFERRGYG